MSIPYGWKTTWSVALPRAISAGPRRWTRRLVQALSILFVAYLALPLAALLGRVAHLEVVRALRDETVLTAIRLTAITTMAVALVVVGAGTPLAYLLARRSFRGKAAVEALVELPIALPPVIAGVALLMAFGRRGLLGPMLERLGVVLPFTPAAVVMAQLYVSSAFYIRGATLGFRAIPRELEEAAAVDGAGGWQIFRHITLPLAMPGLLSGLLLCLTRAASEFGATLMFAGNLPGRTQTLTLAVMTAMETDLERALALSLLLLAIALGVTLGARLWLRPQGIEG